MARGFVYLAAVVDWFSRRVVSWRVAIGMEIDFRPGATEEAMAKYGRQPVHLRRVDIGRTRQAGEGTRAGSSRSIPAEALQPQEATV